MKRILKKESDDDCSVGGNDCSGRLPELFGKIFRKGEESTGDRGGTCQSGVIRYLGRRSKQMPQRISKVRIRQEKMEAVEGTPGEAVLTSGTANAVVAEAKVTREQVRAKNKETLQQIIDSENLRKNRSKTP